MRRRGPLLRAVGSGPPAPGGPGPVPTGGRPARGAPRGPWVPAPPPAVRGAGGGPGPSGRGRPVAGVDPAAGDGRHLAVATTGRVLGVLAGLAVVVGVEAVG